MARWKWFAVATLLFIRVPGDGHALPAKPEKVLVHMVVNETDPSLGAAPGEQSLVHRLYMVDLTHKKILGQASVGGYARVFFAHHTGSVWVAQRAGTDQTETRIRHFDLPGFDLKKDVTAPLLLNAATDSEGRFMADRQIAVLDQNHVLLIGSLPGSGASDRNLVSVDIGKKKTTVTPLTTLSGKHIECAGVLNVTASSAVALFGGGDGLLVTSTSGNVSVAPSTGLAPIPFNTEVHESLQISEIDPNSGAVIAVSSSGTVYKGIPGAGSTTSVNVGATNPEQVTISPNGDTAGIRYRTDVTNNLSSIAVVSLTGSGAFTAVSLPSDGAVLQLSATKALIADGPTIRELDTTNPDTPAIQEVFRFDGVPVSRILRIYPLN